MGRDQEGDQGRDQDREEDQGKGQEEDQDLDFIYPWIQEESDLEFARRLQDELNSQPDVGDGQPDGDADLLDPDELLGL